MQKFKTLSDAIDLAKFAHRNQLDKAGLAYVEHPLRVMATVQAMGGRPYVQIAAVLHDVTEDTAFTLEILLALGFSEAAVNLVRLLDRNDAAAHYPDSSKEHQDKFYYSRIKGNPDALMIKVADIRDNLSPWRLSYLPEATQERLRDKYAKALDSLSVVL